MPYSSSEGKYKVVEWISARKERIRSVLDVGPGVGTYADLLRPSMNPGTIFTGVEIWGPYIERYGLDKKYDEIIIGDIRHVNLFHLDMDLTILGDVLEHLPKEDVEDVLDNVFCNYGYVLISIPIQHVEFGSFEGNPYDSHKMENMWTEEEMEDLITSFEVRVVEKFVGAVVAYFLVDTNDC